MTYEKLNSYYGNPANPVGGFDQDWYDRNIEMIDVPFFMRTTWQPYDTITRLRVHKKAKPIFEDALKRIHLHRGEGYLVNRGYNYCAGTYNFRKITGGNKLSTHSWGISIDLNPHLSPYRKKGTTRTPEGPVNMWVNDQPEFIINIMLELGFDSFEFDGMHFQLCRGRSIYTLSRAKEE